MEIISLYPDHPLWKNHRDWIVDAYQKGVAEEFSKSPMASLRKIDPAGAPLIQEMLEDLLSNRENVLFLLVLKESKPAGYFLGLVKSCPGEIPAEVAYVNGLYVEPTFRRLGLATLLANEGFRWFKEKKMEMVELYAALNNAEGQKFWAKYGFKPFEQVYFTQLK